MALSVMVALILTPALAATILPPGDPLKHEGNGPFDRFFRWFNSSFDRARLVHEKGVRKTIGGVKRAAAVYLLIFAVMGLCEMGLRPSICSRLNTPTSIT